MMDLYDIIKLVVIPIALGVTAHQYLVLWKLKSDIAKKLEETEVRNIITDKIESLKLADEAAKDRIAKIELELDHINEKLDKILELLYKTKD